MHPERNKYRYTPEQMERAQKRYESDVAKMYADGYVGDFGCGLIFAMDTYAPICWLKYFEEY